ncbi:hypothetical protein [Gracilibacillus phocaeensis]|uniref:hypothetical protein n=1 Tax=Gracilibacillus phocaeensis TaxID=2042304 RepID=UPI000A6C9458|nr:hypothetical protein [Gracilibacillus phocaeensis]
MIRIAFVINSRTGLSIVLSQINQPVLVMVGAYDMIAGEEVIRSPAAVCKWDR